MLLLAEGSGAADVDVGAIVSGKVLVLPECAAAEVWKAEMRMFEVVLLLGWDGAGEESRRNLVSLLSNVLAARGMPRTGRRVEKSVRRRVEENSVPALSDSLGVCLICVVEGMRAI